MPWLRTCLRAHARLLSCCSTRLACHCHCCSPLPLLPPLPTLGTPYGANGNRCKSPTCKRRAEDTSDRGDVDGSPRQSRRARGGGARSGLESVAAARVRPAACTRMHGGRGRVSAPTYTSEVDLARGAEVLMWSAAGRVHVRSVEAGAVGAEARGCGVRSTVPCHSGDSPPPSTSRPGSGTLSARAVSSFALLRLRSLRGSDLTRAHAPVS